MNPSPIRFLVPLVFFIGIFAFATPAWAHANLVRSEPAANSASPIPPTQVRLWFSEEIEPRFTMISVLNTSGIPVDQHDARPLPDDPKAMQVSLPPLAPGLYTVVWQALSAADGHTTAGSFSFTVGDKPLTESSPRQIITQVNAALALRELPPLWQIAIRWFNLLTLVFLVGSLAFPILILRASINSADAWRARWLALMRTAIVLCMLAMLALLVLQTFIASGGFTSIVPVLTATRFGVVWCLRAAMLVGLSWLMFRAKNFSLGLAFALGVVFAITQSLNSHNAAVDTPPLIPLFIDIVHLLAVSIWVGGLAQLLFTVPVFLQSFTAEQGVQQLAGIIARFSLVAFISVGAMVATGFVAAIFQVGSLEAFFDTLYGQVLFVKIAMLVPLLTLAAFNLIVMRPAVAHAIAQKINRLAVQFNAAVALELVLALAILFIVGILTSTAPARIAYDATPQLFIETHRVDDVKITLGAAPGKIGANDFDVYLRDSAGNPVTDASVVRLLGEMREMKMGVQELTTKPQGNGHYTLHADLLSMAGTWDIEVLARRPNRDDTRTTFTLSTVNQPAPASSSLALELSQTPVQIGLALTLFGFAFGIANALLIRLRQMRLIGMLGSIVVASIGAYVVIQTPAPAASALNVVIPIAPDFARTLRMPFRVDANRLAQGRQTYTQFCETCHGASGKGDGPTAARLNPRPIDLTVHVRQHTEGELYWWVTNGIPGTAMPGWSTSLDDEQRWQVVAYIRAAFGDSATPTPLP